MGQINIITSEQQLLLSEFKKNTFLLSNFYFTGGTALSLYYLQHRESVDLDFFSEKKFIPQNIFTILTTWKEDYHFEIEYTPLEDMQVFFLTFPNKNIVKVDFAYYPYKRIEKAHTINGIEVDSRIDIAVNKLLVIQQRTEVKDFVDLYFLLKEFSIWDLIEGVKIKFDIKMDPLIISSDFLKVESFTYLPTMITPLTLDEVKQFFKKMATDIGMKELQ